jgi:uncharacterized protein YndB with AHSA1/START domain
VELSEPVIKEIFIEAQPEEIFSYLTQGDKFVQWMGLVANIEARPGGIFRLDPNHHDIIEGEFLEVEAPKRVVFTWGWVEPGHPVAVGSTVVEIDLIARDGGTLLRLTHRDLPTVMRDRHDSGWLYYLRRLQSVLAGIDPGPDRYRESRSNAQSVDSKA